MLLITLALVNGSHDADGHTTSNAMSRGQGGSIREVKVLYDAISAERYTTSSPQEHHARGHAVCGFGAPICPYLRDQLHTPKDGAYRAEDGR